MQRTIWNAFKNFAIVFSFVVNFVLVVVVIVLVINLFTITNGIAEPLIDGLHGNFVALDSADIIRQISVQDEIPVAFTLNLREHPINVRLTGDVPLTLPAVFNLPGGTDRISGTVNLALPEGLELPLVVFMDVPVDEMVPVNLLVDVEIPLSETQLHDPFYRLRMLFEPFVNALDALPESYSDMVSPAAGGGS
ncbi:MAG: hypothetical protein JXB47_09900 [Anaerolineae bacterium]|nr:hypothetical protein [Anaerolineae bacterium]